MLERALNCASGLATDRLAGPFGHDPGTTTLMLLGAAKYLLGSREEGSSVMSQAAEEARMRGHPLSLAYNVLLYAVIASTERNYPLVESLSAELTSVCRKYQIRQWYNIGPLMTAWVRCCTEPDQATIDLIGHLLLAHRGTGFRRYMPLFLSLFAEGLLSAQRFDEAQAIIDEAKVLVHEIGETWIEPRILALSERLTSRTA